MMKLHIRHNDQADGHYFQTPRETIKERYVRGGMTPLGLSKLAGTELSAPNIMKALMLI